MNKIIIWAVVGVIVIGGGYLLSQNSVNTNVEDDKKVAVADKFGTGQKAILYKDPNCGCCVGYADELEEQGFDVETISTKDMANIKDKHNLPANKQSCHTIEIAGYVIEGHVPMEAVEKLLTEKPDIDGIGLPRMPSGTPGMPGPKRAPYEVYQIKSGEFSNYVTI